MKGLLWSFLLYVSVSCSFDLSGGVRGGVEGAVAMSTSKDCGVCFVTVKHIW